MIFQRGGGVRTLWLPPLILPCLLRWTVVQGIAICFALFILDICICWFFLLVWRHLSAITSECQTAWTQIRPKGMAWSGFKLFDDKKLSLSLKCNVFKRKLKWSNIAFSFDCQYFHTAQWNIFNLFEFSLLLKRQDLLSTQQTQGSSDNILPTSIH